MMKLGTVLVVIWTCLLAGKTIAVPPGPSCDVTVNIDPPFDASGSIDIVNGETHGPKKNFVNGETVTAFNGTALEWKPKVDQQTKGTPSPEILNVNCDLSPLTLDATNGFCEIDIDSPLGVDIFIESETTSASGSSRILPKVFAFEYHVEVNGIVGPTKTLPITDDCPDLDATSDVCDMQIRIPNGMTVDIQGSTLTGLVNGDVKKVPTESTLSFTVSPGGGGNEHEVGNCENPLTLNCVYDFEGLEAAVSLSRSNLALGRCYAWAKNCDPISNNSSGFTQSECDHVSGGDASTGLWAGPVPHFCGSSRPCTGHSWLSPDGTCIESIVGDCFIGEDCASENLARPKMTHERCLRDGMLPGIPFGRYPTSWLQEGSPLQDCIDTPIGTCFASLNCVGGPPTYHTYDLSILSEVGCSASRGYSWLPAGGNINADCMNLGPCFEEPNCQGGEYLNFHGYTFPVSQRACEEFSVGYMSWHPGDVLADPQDCVTFPPFEIEVCAGAVIDFGGPIDVTDAYFKMSCVGPAVNGDCNFNGGGTTRLFSTNTDGSIHTIAFEDIVFFNGGDGMENGGAFLLSGGTTSFTDCQFRNNNANSGGAIYVTHHPGRLDGQLTITGSSFQGNTASSGVDIYSSGAPVVVDCSDSFNIFCDGLQNVPASPADVCLGASTSGPECI